MTDYVRCSGRLKSVLGEHIRGLLAAGISVVLDFPDNTVDGRHWSKALFEKVGRAPTAFSDVADEICKGRLHARNAAGNHPFKTTDEEFDLISSYFVPPTEEEGFNLIRYKP